MAMELVIWWLLLQVFGLLGLPVASFVFQALPDRGYAFSKSLGLLLTGYGVWLLAMFGLGGFSVPLVLLVMALLAALGGLLLHFYWRLPFTDPAALRARLTDALMRHWRGILAYELLFVVALVGLAWVRGHSMGFVGPNPWGTERPMDFAFFNSIRYSTSFPPTDPWLSGFSINYYYFGYLLMALLALLSGLEPAVTYNLALAGIFALAALGVAGIVSNLVSLVQRAQSSAEDPPRSLRSDGVRGLVALLGVVMVLLAGNQAGALQVIVGDQRVVALDARQLGAAVGQALTGADDTIELPYPAHTSEGDFGAITHLERSDRLADFDWWWPSRAVWDAYTPPDPAVTEGAQERRYTITEFPFFSFWLGDMHPHVMALPFNLLALALALATVARPELPQFAVGRAGWLDLLLTGVVLGSLYTINSWDLPTYLLLYVGALVLLHTRASAYTVRAWWLHLGGQLVLVVLAAFALFLPFHLTFQSLVGFKEPLLNVPVLGRLTTIIAPFIEDNTSLHSFLIIFGLFVVPLVALAYCHLGTSHGTQRPVWEARLSIWGLPLLLLVGLLVGFPLLALAGLGVAAFVAALRHVAAPAVSFVLLVVALGCAVAFGTDVVYIRDVFEGGSARLNTLFKFYYQVWLLWGTTAPFALWWLWQARRQPADAASTSRKPARVVVYAVSGLCALLLAGALVYPAINLRDVAQDGTWAGLAGRTPREIHPAEAEAMEWLRAHAAPGSVVLEMVGPGGGSYNNEGYAAIAAATGRPTVLGWVGHQRQWRGGDSAARAQLDPRMADVETIYSTTDAQVARELLQTYDVDYVYVGQLEQQAYAPEALAKFAQIGEPVHFQDGAVTIYRLHNQ